MLFIRMLHTARATQPQGRPAPYALGPSRLKPAILLGPQACLQPVQRVHAVHVYCQATEAPGAPTEACVPDVSSSPDEWFTPRELPPHIGPIELKLLEGRGRGVVATRDIQPGELLICTPPVAIVNTPPGHPRADGERLVDHLVEDSLWLRAWFRALYTGTPASASSCPNLSMPHDTLHTEDSLSDGTSGAQAAESSKTGFAAAATKSKVRKSKVKKAATVHGPLLDASVLDKRTLKRIAQTTKLNCYGDEHEDLALCELRGEQPRGHIGVWGPFAMLNHSCAPNAINYCVGDSMIVRAAANIKAGEEVSISYLGRPQLHPVGARRLRLHDDYGFQCVCHRCVAEEEHIDKLDTSLYEELHVHVAQRMREQFEQAVDEQDDEELQELHHQLQASLQALSAQFRRTMMGPQARLFIMASLYEALELQVELCDALGLLEDKAYHLGQALKCIQAVSPGSDLHNILASQHYAAQVQLHGEQSREAQAALALAQPAVLARYGQVTPQTQEKLMLLNRTLYK